MDKITLKIENSNCWNNDLVNYLMSLDGVKDVKEDSLKEEVYVEYDSLVIPMKILKTHIIIYLNVSNLPSIAAFDKHIDNSINDTIVIDNLCCEYCLHGAIEELLDTLGIISAYSDFDYHNKKNVNIFITYDDKIIGKDKINELKEKYKNY